MASVSVTWYGQAGFRLAAGDSRVLIDPFLTDRDDRRYPPPATAAEFADVTLVLCTAGSVPLAQILTGYQVKPALLVHSSAPGIPLAGVPTTRQPTVGLMNCSEFSMTPPLVPGTE